MTWQRGAVGAAVLLILAQVTGVNSGLSRWLTDTHWRWRASWRPTPFPKDIIVVAVDDATLKEFGRLRYWSRARYGVLLGRLRQAKAVGIDILLTEPDRSDPQGDAALARAAQAHGRTAFACYEWTEPRQFSEREQKQIESGLSRFPRGDRSLVGRLPLVPAEVLELPIPLLTRSAAAVGTAETNADEDGVFRAPVVLKMTYEGKLVVHLSLALARLAAGVPPDETALVPGGLRLGRRFVPLTNGAIMLEPIARRGQARSVSAQGPGQRVPTVSFSAALSMPPSAFAGKIVLIGETATGTSDVRPNPLDPGLRGVELDAEILANLLYLPPVRAVPWPLQWLIIALAVGAPSWLYQALDPRRANWGALVMLVALVGAMESAFWFGRWVPAWSPVLIGFAGTTLLMAMQRFAHEEAQKRQLRQSFSTYVAPELVEAIVANPEIAHQEGTRRRVAVLFSDVRGFTPYCEQYAPEHVVRQMREYADEMTAAVESSDGVLDKLTGDGVMALFGPFLPVGFNISALAVESALEMFDRLEKLNASWTSRGMPPFAIGIGIHVGDAIVGNIGASRRMQYTALGDTVNLASRLQEATKQFNATLLVTQEVKDEAEPVLQGKVHFVPHGDVALRGRERSVTVYGVVRAPVTAPQEIANAPP